MKKILITGISLLFIASCYAQQKWSYKDCINYALVNNLNLDNYEIDTRLQKLNYKSAINNFLPSIGANAGYDLRQGRSVDPNTNDIVEREFFSNSYSVGADLLIFNGFRQQNQLAYEKYRLTAVEEDYEKQKNDISFLVLDAFVTHLINSGLAEIQQEQLDLSKQEVHRIKKRIELGLSSGSELYEAEARVAADEYQLIQYQNLVNNSENNLKRLMNLPVDSLLMLKDIEIDDEEIVHIETDSIVDIARQKLPEVKSTYALLQSAKEQMQASRSALSPSLYAYGNWRTGYYETSVNQQGEVIPFNDQMKNNRNLNYGLSLNIPIFDKFRRQNQLQQAKVNHERAKNDLKILFQDMEYEVNQAILDWQGAVAEYQSAQKNEKSMELAFEVAEKKREKGLISIMDYYEAKNNLSSAKAEVLRTELQLFMKERTINFYLTGSLIE